jgi:hypothetical protein
MEAARTSETSVNNYFTRQYIPEDKSELHTRRRENLKSNIVSTVYEDFGFRVNLDEHMIMKSEGREPEEDKI